MLLLSQFCFPSTFNVLDLIIGGKRIKYLSSFLDAESLPGDKDHQADAVYHVVQWLVDRNRCNSSLDLVGYPHTPVRCFGCIHHDNLSILCRLLVLRHNLQSNNLSRQKCVYMQMHVYFHVYREIYTNHVLCMWPTAHGLLASQL